MFNIGSGELVLIAVVALLVLGPKRLPELARGVGKFLREFRRQTDEVRGVVEREFYKMDQEIDGAPPQLTGAAPAEMVPVASEGAVAIDAEPPMDHSDPRHPDYGKPDPHLEAEESAPHPEEPVAPAPAAAPAAERGAEPGVSDPEKKAS